MLFFITKRLPNMSGKEMPSFGSIEMQNKLIFLINIFSIKKLVDIKYIYEFIDVTLSECCYTFRTQHRNELQIKLYKSAKSSNEINFMNILLY